MPVTMATVNNALKVLYPDPIRENIRLKSDPMIARILQDTTKIVGAQSIVRDAQVGVNGGVGAGTETGALPSAGENQYEQIASTTKNLFGTIEMSDKVMKAVTGANAGSFIDVLDREMNGMLRTSRWNYARMAYGNGNGVLVTCKANASASTTIEPATGDNVRFLLPGLKVDLLNSSGTPYSGKTGMRIKDVDFKTNKFILDTSTAIVAGDVLAIQGSYGLEMTGLGKLFETLAGSETLYGKNRADFAWLRPYLDASFGAIDEIKLTNVINMLEDHWDVSINHLAFGNSAYNYYLQLMNERRVTNDTMVLEGGHKALKFNGMPLVRNPHLADAEINILDTSIFTVDMIADWDWIDGTTGVMNQKPGYPVFTGSVTKYCDLMCVLPAGMAKLTGVAAPAA